MNQYRCENCTKEDCWYFKMRDDSRTIKDKYGELLTPRSFTWEKGCASHSDFQREREKVLNDCCNIDLTEYTKGERESDEVGLCRGRECNYCGRYNELREVNHEPVCHQ